MNQSDVEHISSIVDEFYRNAIPSDLVQRVQEEIMKESAKNPIDEYWIRMNRDWSILGNQVMGFEKF